jgi:sugar/nucleoside kinase (ribokinase family)
LTFPRSLLGYTPLGPQIDSRITPTSLTIRLGDFPQAYLDCTAAHLCPLDYVSHSLLPSALRQGHISTITLDPAAGYMNPTFWNEIPALINGITALLVSEEKVCNLFQGRSTDLWEMAETLAGYNCEIVVIKRGANGQFLYDRANKSRWIIPSYPARVLDPTGAGDAFCGGFLSGYRNTYSPLQATLFGNISASLAVEGSGPFYAMDALPALAQARLESLQNMVRKA